MNNMGNAMQLSQTNWDGMNLHGTRTKMIRINFKVLESQGVK